MNATIDVFIVWSGAEVTGRNVAALRESGLVDTVTVMADSEPDAGFAAGNACRWVQVESPHSSEAIVAIEDLVVCHQLHNDRCILYVDTPGLVQWGYHGLHRMLQVLLMSRAGMVFATITVSLMERS